ncbi:hypothetical protein ACFVH6_08070 [Spirillospora sp. NPDC127200]
MSAPVLHTDDPQVTPVAVPLGAAQQPDPEVVGLLALAPGATTELIADTTRRHGCATIAATHDPVVMDTADTSSDMLDHAAP